MIQNIEEIKNRLDPVDVLNFIGHEKSHPKKSGGEIRDYCPIHGGDNQQSLAINEATKLFHCHSCGAKGDLISLYQQAKQIDFSEAIETLASRFQINIQREKKESIIAEKQVIPVENVWSLAKEGNGHPYLSKKGVKPCPGLRYGKDAKGNHSIVVPFYDVEGNLKTVQHIHEKGKYFLLGHSPSAAFFPIGLFKDGDIVYLAEGIATTITIKEEIQGAAISFGSAGNMAKVVNALKGKYPNLKIIICLDDNDAALKAAQQINHSDISFRKPSFAGLAKSEDDADFNDLKKLADSQVLRDQLQNVFTFPFDENTSQAPSKDKPIDSAKKGKCIIIGEALEKSGFLQRIRDKTLEYRQNGIVKLSGLPTNFKKLDEIIDGLQGGHLVILAGRTGMGKTYAALNLLKNISIEQKIPASLYSLEMSNSQVFYRLISLCCGVSPTKIKRGTLTDEELFKVEEAIKKIESSPLFVTDDPANSNLFTLSENIRSSCDNGQVKAVFIDHIGLVNCGIGYKDNRATELGQISMTFKLMAKQYNIPVICLAQLNRDADSRDPPKLSQLKDSGHLEQNADIVLFIHRKDYFDPTDKPEQADIIVSKNREGEIGTVVFKYKKSSWLLEELLPLNAVMNARNESNEPRGHTYK
jgi:replicative DNA helicase